MRWSNSTECLTEIVSLIYGDCILVGKVIIPILQLWKLMRHFSITTENIFQVGIMGIPYFLNVSGMLTLQLLNHAIQSFLKQVLGSSHYCPVLILKFLNHPCHLVRVNSFSFASQLVQLGTMRFSRARASALAAATPEFSYDSYALIVHDKKSKWKAASAGSINQL